MIGIETRIDRRRRFAKIDRQLQLEPGIAFLSIHVVEP